MDCAKMMKDSREIIVFAHEIDDRSKKHVPWGARFKCPYCDRPVDLAALI